MIGRTVGQYEIEAQLGAGGMGVVYKAHDVKLDRTVALKFLPPHLSQDNNAKQRFIQEARAASALDHANICTIHDIGEDDDGQLFIVMSFYDGQTLKYKLENGPLQANEATTIAYQIALGLKTSHEAGIVHRDIKPANIMVTSRDEAKILDFGVAKLSESVDLTKSGATVGTATYMSPEQARSEPVDHRADIWSIGVLLYEMLVGSRPFEGGYEAALIYSIINQDPPPLPDSLPDGIESIVFKCLNKAADDRYQSAEELARDLESFVSSSGLMRVASSTEVETSDPVPVHPPSLPKVAITFVGAAVVVLGIVYAGMIFFGLPDWVFIAGIVLMAIGLPVTLYAAHSESSRKNGSILSLRKATLGGVFAMTGLVLFSAGFMLMRSLGIGPAATLVSSGALEENAQVIIADFENATDDETLGESVTEALRIDLSQSTAISLMEGSAIGSVLTRMGRDQGADIDLDTAMEIATREGAEAVVSGHIRPVGQGYVLSARLLGAADGTELVALRENANDDGAIIDAIDRLSKQLRTEIGESIKTIRSNKNLDYVSTSSLEALRLYSQSVNMLDTGDVERSTDLLLQAVELDSTFAMAYRKLAVNYFNMGAPHHLKMEASRKAFELRDHLPERERWMATAHYYANNDRDNEKEIGAYQSLLEKYPDELPALNNLGMLYNIRGEAEKGVPYFQHALSIGDRPAFYDNLIDSYGSLKRWEEMDLTLSQFEERFPDHPGKYMYRFYRAMGMRDYEEADTLLRMSSMSDSPAWKAAEDQLRGRYLGFRGRFEEAEVTLRNLAQTNLDRGSSDVALNNLLQIAYNYVDGEDNADMARNILIESLGIIPLDSLPPVSRPYSSIVWLLSRIGDVEGAKAYLAEYKDLVPAEERAADFTIWHAEGQVALGEGNTEEALELFKRVQTVANCGVCSVHEQALTHELLGNDDEAIELHLAETENTFSAMWWYFGEEIPLSHLRLGELYSNRNDLDNALEHYSQFVEMWADADEDVQHRVQYARDRIDALVAQQAREPQ